MFDRHAVDPYSPLDLALGAIAYEASLAKLLIDKKLITPEEARGAAERAAQSLERFPEQTGRAGEVIRSMLLGQDWPA